MCVIFLFPWQHLSYDLLTTLLDRTQHRLVVSS